MLSAAPTRDAGPAPARPGAVVLLLAAVGVLHAAWLGGAWGRAMDHPLVADAFLLPLFPAIAWASTRVAARAALPTRLRQAWGWLAAAYVLLAAGNVVWTVSDARPGESGWTVPTGTLLVLASYVPLFVGLRRLRAQRADRAQQVRLTLDLATVMLGVTLGLWFVFRTRPTMPPDPTALDLVRAFGAPVADFAVLQAIAALLLDARGPSDRRALRLLLLGHALSVVAGLVGTWLGRSTAVGPGHWVDALWFWSAALLYAAADVQRRAPVAAARPAVEGAPGGTLVRWLPYAAVAGTFALLVVVARPRWHDALAPFLYGAGAMGALVVARQLLVLREYRRAAAELRETQRANRTLLDNLPGMAYRCRDEEGWTMELVSDGALALTGYAPGRFLASAGAQRVTFESLIHEADRDGVREAVQAAVAADRPFTVGYRLRTATGEERHVWEKGRAVRGPDGAVLALEGLVLDVTDRQRLEAQLAHQAYHDPLTGLANRSLFRERTTQALARAARDGRPPAILFLDLDDFKAVNDSLGHAAGDQLLVEVARRVRAAVHADAPAGGASNADARPEDASADAGEATVARLGGDEFAVLVERPAGAAEVERVATRLLAALEAPFVLAGQETAVAASAGLVLARDDDGIEALLRRADVAMYQAKARGKGQWALFSEAMDGAHRLRVELARDLRHAVARDELRLALQPIVDLRTERVLGVEALVRWAHPVRGLVPPSTFIPVAEETGDVLALGRWVLRAACAAAATWHRTRSGAPYVAVNLSARQLAAPDLVADVAAALVESGLPPGALLLEVTESVVMEETASNLRRLHELKRLGVRLAIDDFGTGYSSLAYLQRFPVDVLKIDKRFVDGVAESENDAALARAIITLGSALGLETVAEGIEHPAQRQRLMALGCRLGQGYLFARPMAVADLADFLDAPAAAAVA